MSEERSEGGLEGEEVVPNENPVVNEGDLLDYDNQQQQPSTMEEGYYPAQDEPYEEAPVQEDYFDSPFENNDQPEENGYVDSPFENDDDHTGVQPPQDDGESPYGQEEQDGYFDSPFEEDYAQQEDEYVDTPQQSYEEEDYDMQQPEDGYVDSPFDLQPEDDYDDYVGDSPYDNSRGQQGVYDDGYGEDDPYYAERQDVLDSPFGEALDDNYDGEYETRSMETHSLMDDQQRGWSFFGRPNDNYYEDDYEDDYYDPYAYPEFDEERPPKKKRGKKYADAVDDEDKRRRRRRWCWLLCCCLLLLLLLLLIGGAIFAKKKGDDDEESEDESDDLPLDEGFGVFKPYEGIKTTPMDPYEQDDCYFGDNVFPHVIQQCKCFGTISIIPNDTLALYHDVREDMNEEIYDGSYDKPIDSCDPSNQALVWISSGDTRDAGDLYQRFLVALSFIQLNGTSWDLKNLWLSNDSECIWLGLQCNGRFQLNNMALDTNNIHGSMPTEVSRLSGLNTLSITRNHLTGTIPTDIVQMPRLQHLLLYANQMRGSIPSEIGLSTSLKTLRLENNLFFGTITTYIGQVTTLEELSIGFNEFWRRIPTEMGGLTNMKWLVMEDNRLSGRVPTQFGMMTDLEYFLISQNLLVGYIPKEFAQLSKLQEFRIANTGVGGELYPGFGEGWPKIHRLELGGNNFVGTIMTEFGLMTSLSWLALNNNDFTGRIPTELGNLVNMTRLSLQDTLLDGNLPSELGLMTKLENFAVDKNGVTGRAPQELCALRQMSLNMFVTDCPSRGNVGVICPIPDCCTFCRRGESSG